MLVGKRILRTALITGSALGLTAGGTGTRAGSGGPRRQPPPAPRRGVPRLSTPPACRPARTGPTTPPTGGLRATTRPPITADQAGGSRGRPTAPALAARAVARARARARVPARPRAGTGSASGLLFSPYKDVTINMNWNTDQMQSAVEGTAIPVVGSGSLVSNYVPEAARDHGGVPPQEPAAARPGAACRGRPLGRGERSAAVGRPPELRHLDRRCRGTFTCASTSGMDSFIARYASSNLVGIDFDIEGGQSQSDIQEPGQRVGWSDRRRRTPTCSFSFTIATLAASDGSYGGVNSARRGSGQRGEGLQHEELRHQPDDHGLRQSFLPVSASSSPVPARNGAVVDPGGDRTSAHLRNPGEQNRPSPR